jgi:plastocyanin
MKGEGEGYGEGTTRSLGGLIVSRRALRRIALMTLTAFSLGQVAGCFSERGVAGPEEGDICDVPLTALGPRKIVVPIFGYQFLTDTIRISVGTEVTWVNCDAQAGNDYHTSTSDTPGVWASPNFILGERYTRTFNQTGTFAYHCVPHPGMRGVVIVQ